MKTTVLGALFVLVILFGTAVAAVGPATPEVSGESLQSAAARDGLIAFSQTVDQKYQQVTVIDPKGRAISVYHIDLASGAIALRSVRNINWDLQIADFNGKAPLSREIQALAEKR